MASAWGNSWGAAWGNSWGSISVAETPARRLGVSAGVYAWNTKQEVRIPLEIAADDEDIAMAILLAVKHYYW